MLQATLSSQVQTIFMPPWHFSNLKVQRGTMTMFGVAGIALPPIGVVPMPGIPMPGMPIPVRSIIIVLDMERKPPVADWEVDQSFHGWSTPKRVLLAWKGIE
jgi:hypothetical protein